MYRACFLFLFLFLAGPAFAKDKARDVKYIIPPITEHEFDTLDVTGALNGPSLALVNARPPAEFHSLFRIRSDFDTEMKRSSFEIQ